MDSNTVTIKTMQEIGVHKDAVKELQANLKRVQAKRDTETACIYQDQINFEMAQIAQLMDTPEMEHQQLHWKKVNRSYADGEISFVELFYGRSQVSLAEVRAPHTKFGSPHPAEINWKATGSQKVEFTREFIHLMKTAVQVADQLNDGSLK